MFLPLQRVKKTNIGKKKIKETIIPCMKDLKFDDLKEMPAMHSQYLRQSLLRKNNWVSEKELPLILLKCALEGAVVRITDAKQKSYVGIAGILIMETKFTFVIVNEKKVYTVFKKNTILEFDFNYREEENTAIIYGNAVVNRLFNKKYKAQNTIEFE